MLGFKCLNWHQHLLVNASNTYASNLYSSNSVFLFCGAEQKYWWLKWWEDSRWIKDRVTKEIVNWWRLYCRTAGSHLWSKGGKDEYKETAWKEEHGENTTGEVGKRDERRDDSHGKEEWKTDARRPSGRKEVMIKKTERQEWNYKRTYPQVEGTLLRFDIQELCQKNDPFIMIILFRLTLIKSFNKMFHFDAI